MVKHTKSPASRLAAGLIIALLALSACATANPDGPNTLSRYDRQVLGQVGGG